MMELLAHYRAPVLQEMDRLVGGPPSPVLTMCCYHLGLSDEQSHPTSGSPGKMLRSSLCLAMCEAFGGDVRRRLSVAVSVELIHRTSLVFDDIQDHSPCATDERERERWGDAQAINAGLALSAYCRLALVESDLAQKARIQDHLEEAVLDLCLGQQMDIAFRDAPPTLQQYAEMVLRKTGTLVEAACKVGVLVARQPDAVWGRAALFGDTLTTTAIVATYTSPPDIGDTLTMTGVVATHTTPATRALCGGALLAPGMAPRMPGRPPRGSGPSPPVHCPHLPHTVGPDV